MNFLKNILFVSYLKNKGVRRICFILGLLLGGLSFASEGMSIYPIMLFYMPFIIAVCVRWIYVGFSKNEEIIEAEKAAGGCVAEKIKKIFPVKRLIYFFFSYDGRINRLQYFGGIFFFNFVLYFVIFLNEQIGAIVYIIYLYILLGFIQKRSRDMDEVGTGYIVAFLFGILGINIKDALGEENIMDINSVWGGLLSLLVLPMVGANLCLLFSKGVENPDMDKRSKLTKRPILLVFVMTVMTFISVLSVNYFNQVDNDKDEIALASGILYRHIVIYNDVCEEYGVKLTNYPKIFKNRLKNEIEIIDNILKKEGTTLEEIYRYMNSNNGKIKQLVQEEMDELRMALILGVVSEKQKVPVDKVIWNDKFYSLVSLQETCSFFDEKAETFINNDNDGFRMIKEAVKDISENGIKN